MPTFSFLGEGSPKQGSAVIVSLWGLVWGVRAGSLCDVEWFSESRLGVEGVRVGWGGGDFEGKSVEDTLDRILPFCTSIIIFVPVTSHQYVPARSGFLAVSALALFVRIWTPPKWKTLVFNSWFPSKSPHQKTGMPSKKDKPKGVETYCVWMCRSKASLIRTVNTVPIFAQDQSPECEARNKYCNHRRDVFF